MTRASSIPIAALVLAATGACGDDGSSARAFSYAIAATPVSLGQDSTIQLMAIVSNTTRNEVVPGAPVVYTVEDTTIARVTLKGSLRGIRPGTTTVRARYYDQETSIPVTVRGRPAASVSITPSAGVLLASPGDTIRLDATILGAAGDTLYCNVGVAPATRCTALVTVPDPASTTGGTIQVPRVVRDVVFSVPAEDTSFVSVTSTGLVTAKKATVAGSPARVILASRADNGMADTSSFTITTRAVATVTLGAATPRVGTPVTLTASVVGVASTQARTASNPTSRAITGRPITFALAAGTDASIASITSAGVLTPKRANCIDTTAQSTCTVTVLATVDGVTGSRAYTIGFPP